MNPLIVISALMLIGLASAWSNNYDRQLYFECPDNESINNIKSVHNNHHEDRIWDFECRRSSLVLDSCSWSGFANSYDDALSFQCQNGAGVVTGMKSDHDNHHEDRRWKIKCCKPRSTCYSECKLTPYVNEYDRPLSYSVETGYYLTGMESVHDNHHEDRIWRYRYCKVIPC
ncbi:hemagglutinin/amebocyte aggregation factor-like [Tigriopus californicus]|uniref:hemagglutinin/amebocyte aggregation factor-like n=1 Tax=Tigriopus californicus TaxID=6832 RepID=UPI0027DAB3BD|nr:hemagglutinin/amebocyte aggregation factor-like [Tigriopus californicus]